MGQGGGLAEQLAALAALPAEVARLRVQVDELRAKLAASDVATTDVLVDAEEAARVLGMSVAAVRKAAYRGALPVERIGRRLRFRRSGLVRAGRAAEASSSP